MRHIEVVMKHILTATIIALLASPVAAGKIERACKSSERRVAASLCVCIQRVADNQLTRTDQHLAAKFFKDPDLAQETRQSDDKHKEKFWLRYKAFGAMADKTCR